MEEKERVSRLNEQLEELAVEDETLDARLQRVKDNLARLVGPSRPPFILKSDINSLDPENQHTIIAIRPPSGTQLQVPDPEEGMPPRERRYQIFLKSDSGEPIEAFLVSQTTTVEEEQRVASPPHPQPPPPLPAELFVTPASSQMVDVVGSAPSSFTQHHGGGPTDSPIRAPLRNATNLQAPAVSL